MCFYCISVVLFFLSNYNHNLITFYMYMYIKRAKNEGILQKEGNVAICSPTDGRKDIRMGSVIIPSVNEKALDCGNEGYFGASEDKVSAQDKEVQVEKNDVVDCSFKTTVQGF